MNTEPVKDLNKIRQVTIAAPGIISANFCSQIIELQNHIAGREEGSRFPTLQEATLQCKLINAVDKLKKHAASVIAEHAIEDFIDFIITRDPGAQNYLFDRLEEYNALSDVKGEKPYATGQQSATKINNEPAQPTKAVEEDIASTIENKETVVLANDNTSLPSLDKQAIQIKNKINMAGSKKLKLKRGDKYLYGRTG